MANSQIEQMRASFDKMPTAQKKAFIDRMEVLLQGKNNPEYTEFLNECVQKHNAETHDNASASSGGLSDDLINNNSARTIGNTNSNLSNSGLVVSDGNWVYFSNCNLGIYKMRVDGTEKEKLNDDAANFLNLVGDYLYYVGKDNRLTKMKIDGSEKETIYDKRCLFANVIGKWIYFIELLEGEYSGYVCKVKTDGSSHKRLNNNKHSFCLNVVDDWIYYEDDDSSKDWDNQRKLYRVRIDGTNEHQFNNISCGYSPPFIATDECVYQECFGTMTKSNHDGVALADFDMPQGSYSFCVQDGWIYYFGDCDDDTNLAPLFKMKHDGSKNEKITEVVYNNSSLFVLGEWIYYTTPEFLKRNGTIDEYMQLYRVKTDGTNKEKCVSDSAEEDTKLMQTSQLQKHILQIANANTEKLNSIQKKYESICNQLNINVVTESHISQLNSLSDSLKSMLCNTSEALDLINRLKYLDSDFADLSELENLVAGQKNYINEMISILAKLVGDLTSQKAKIEMAKISNTQKSKTQDSIVPGLLAGVGLGLLSAFTGKPPKSSTKRHASYTSGTKTGRKMGR